MEQVQKKAIHVTHCPTEEMVGDFFMKPLQSSLFIKMHDYIMGNEEPVYQVLPRSRQKYWSKYCWCSLLWLMPLRSLSNCDYELIFYLRLILGPIHSNQVMGTDPVGSHHGTRNSQSNSINPTYPYQSHD